MSDLKNYLDKSISISQIGNTWKKGLCADIVEAARTNSYVKIIRNLSCANVNLFSSIFLCHLK
jgi:hypothetical protein